MFARNLTEPALPVKVEMLTDPREHVIACIVINGFTKFISGPDECEVRTLYKIDDYSVWETEHGLHGCTCRGFEYRDGPNGRACKHIAALYALGLLTRFPPPGCAKRPDVSTPQEILQ